MQDPEAAVTKDECGWEIVAAVEGLARSLVDLAKQYGHQSEREYAAGILAAAGHVRRCAATLALALPVKDGGEVIR